jgi:4-amino-4-deoxy-L-arabinose transferase-like glycosyltransferase
MQFTRGVPDSEHTKLAARTLRPKWLFAIGLLGLCLLVYVPGFFTIPPVDRDESRFAQASRQMLESVALPAGERDPALHSGGLAIPMVQDRPRLNKPPLIYWLQAASAALFAHGDPARDAIWMYRFPSLLSAIAAAFLTWRLGASMFGPAVGRLAALMLAVCPILAWESHQARADMLLLACTTGAMASLWSIYAGSNLDRPRSRSGPFLFWLFLAAAIMTKGPIAPMIAALTAGAIGLTTRRWSWLRATKPLFGVIILAAATCAVALRRCIQSRLEPVPLHHPRRNTRAKRLRQRGSLGTTGLPPRSSSRPSSGPAPS